MIIKLKQQVKDIQQLETEGTNLLEGDEVDPEAGGDGEEGDREPADEVGEHQQGHAFCDPVEMQSRLSFLK